MRECVMFVSPIEEFGRKNKDEMYAPQSNISDVRTNRLESSLEALFNVQ